MVPLPPGARLVPEAEMDAGATPTPDHETHERAWLPQTRLGRWAVALAVAGVLLVLAWSLLGPLGAFPGFGFQAAGGICALVAILRRRERAVAVYVALIPLASVVLFVTAELLLGHE